MTQLRLNHPKLAKLTPAHIEARRKALREAPTRSGPRRGERRADSTPNRDMTCIHAALNLALTDGLITSGFAWRAKPRPIKNADRRREIYLDRAPWQRYASATSIGVWKYSRSGTTKQAVNAGPRYPRSRQRSSSQPRRTSFRRRPCSAAAADRLGTRMDGSGRSRRLSISGDYLPRRPLIRCVTVRSAIWCMKVWIF